MSEQVTLEMMLSCRENRVREQNSLISSFSCPVISFCMNTAGPVKTSVLVRRAFRCGIRRLEGGILASGAKILSKQIQYNTTGPEAFFCVDADPLVLKIIACEVEDADALGRLFDIDVIAVDGSKIERTQTGRPERLCLLCSNSAKICSSRRLHSVEQLWERTEKIIRNTVPSEEADLIASTAVKALLYEVCVTPKPGLVDRNNSGAHSDMDIYTFMGSASALYPYFRKAYLLGLDSEDPASCFKELRKEGLEAEKTMFLETGGVNTHKGAVFTMGIVCAATGICASADSISTDNILSACRNMTSGITQNDLGGLTEENCRTKGQELFVKYGITGIRGEMEKGLPSVRSALGFFESLLKQGDSFDRAGAKTLYRITACIDDTSLIARGGPEKADAVKKQAQSMMKDKEVTDSYLEDLDRTFIRQNLSPGGAADLLAVCFFLHFIKELNNG